MRRPRAIAIAVAIAVGAIAALLGVRAALHDGPFDRLRAAGDGTFTGSIHLPRSGRYVFGCQCTGSIQVAGQTVALTDPSGVHGRPLDLPAGAAPITVRAPRGARLLWHPPGRRGPLEYLPASSLSPEPPARARFGALPGAAPLDFAVALGVLAVLAGLALWLAGPALRRALSGHRTTALAALGVLALALAARLVELGGAGQTWDEDVNWSAGRNYVTNLVALDFAPRSWIWNYEHPPVMKYVAGLGAQIADGYGPARALSALLVALGCALLVPIGARLWSRRAGVAAGVVAALTPHLIAHGKVVGHEAPTVLWWTLGLWLALRAFDDLPAAPRHETRALLRRFALIGVVLGLAIFSRFVNGLLAPLLGIVLLVQAPEALRRKTIALGLAVLPVVALAVGFLLWPRLWTAPIEHLGEAWAKLSKPHTPEPFLGEVTATPPRWYFLAYLYATAPLGVLLAVAAFAVRAGRAGRAEWRATVVVLALFVVPLGVALSPVRQDGVRYVMPSVVALALAAGAGVDAAAAWLRRPRAFAALLGALALYLAITCARIHPYYLDYYGEQVGGPAGVARARSFELGWWGEGLHEATAYVARHAAPGDKIHRECVEALHVAWFHWEAWANLVRRADDADWIVVQPASRACHVPAGFTLAHAVTAQGAPLVKVYRRTAPSR